jgi:hypothetical protein
MPAEQRSKLRLEIALAVMLLLSSDAGLYAIQVGVADRKVRIALLNLALFWLAGQRNGEIHIFLHFFCILLLTSTYRFST